MGNAAARCFGIEQADITLEESVNGMVKVVCSSSWSHYSTC